MTLPDLSDSWAALAAETPASDQVRVRPLGVPTSAGDLRIGRDALGHLHLLIPVTSESDVREDRRSKGVQILRTSLLEHSETIVFADVVCLAPHLTALFERLAAEMVGAIIENPRDPLRTCGRILDGWRELLERSSPPLGPDALAGLFAELWHLRRIVALDPRRRVDCWSGPTSDRHDFRRGGEALEVKATTAREGRFVEIHGLWQLEVPESGVLHLAFTRLERSEAGESVPGLIRSLLEAGVSSREFGDLLGLIGYQRSQEGDYESLRFSVLEHRVYPVDESFPRIIHGSFVGGTAPAGVLDLRYRIDLTGEPPTPLAEDDAVGVLRAMAGG